MQYIRVASAYNYGTSMNKKFFTVFLTLAVFCAFQASARDLKIGMSQFPSTFHPGIDAMQAKNYIQGFARRPVTGFDKDWQRTCFMCEELPTLENGLAKVETRGDGTKGIAVTFKIPANAVWGDGTPITTRDILFSYEVGKNPDTGISNFQLYQKDIRSIDAVDDKTFTIHTDRVTCEFADLTDFSILPEHLEGPVFRQDPKTYRNRTLYDTKPTEPGLYFGPYVVSDVKTGSSVTLTKNPKWWGKQPAFENITVKTIENTTALTAQLLSGGIDMIAGEVGLSVDQALALEKRFQQKNDKRFQVIYKPGLTYEHIDLNLSQPLFADVKVRRALLMGIDRKTIIDTLFGGTQTIAATGVHPLDAVYDDSIKAVPFDAAQAEKLLDEAKCPKGADGVRVCENGGRLSFTFTTTAGNQSREMIEQAIQRDWKKIGVEAKIKNEIPRVLFGETAQKRKFDGALLFAWMSAPRNIPRTTLHSSMVPAEGNGWAGQNFAGYRNDAMDKIIDDLEVTCEPAANKALWTDLQKLYADDLPAIPLYFRADSFVIPSGMTGLVPTGHQFPTSLWVEDWQLP